jgi:hypothetical protein
MSAPPPLSAAELAEIRERHESALFPRPIMKQIGVHWDVSKLLAHIDALTADLANVRAERLKFARLIVALTGGRTTMSSETAIELACVAGRIVATAEREEVERGG